MIHFQKKKPTKLGTLNISISFSPTFSLGPKQNTVADFWFMVWQEHIEQIIMLTNVMEGNTVNNVGYIFLLFCFLEICLRTICVIITFRPINLQAKCFQYWPDLDTSIDCDSFTLNATDERHYAYYVIRKLKMIHKEVKSLNLAQTTKLI